MGKVRKLSLQSRLELMTTRMIDEVLTNGTTEADNSGSHGDLCFSVLFCGIHQKNLQTGYNLAQGLEFFPGWSVCFVNMRPLCKIRRVLKGMTYHENP